MDDYRAHLSKHVVAEWVIILAIGAWKYFGQYDRVKMTNIIAIYTKIRNTILAILSLGNAIWVFLILLPTLRSRA
jgi:hypothetical protein